ncbi:MAG TPA: ribokinase [Bellilinea sp.]|nr:ribokinase [Bellilinea sp.]
MGIITVIGSLNMDLVVRTPHAPKAGETLAGTDFHLIPGGKGANQAVAAARAGAAVRMVGCIGEDAFGPLMLDSLMAAGVEVSGVSRLSDVATGTATIIVEDGGQNRIIVVPGANGKLTPDFIQRQWLTIQQSDLILLQHEIPLATVHAVIEQAYAAGIRVLLNPAPFYPIPADILAKVDTLVVNVGEAEALTGLAVTDAKTARSAAASLTDLGVASVIITLGANGALLRASNNDLFQPAFQVEVVDTTAAGDTFTGSFAASILHGLQPQEALHFASAASALAVTRLGAQTSIPAKDEVEDFLASHSREIA